MILSLGDQQSRSLTLIRGVYFTLKARNAVTQKNLLYSCVIRPFVNGKHVLVYQAIIILLRYLRYFLRYYNAHIAEGQWNFVRYNNANNAKG